VSELFPAAVYLLCFATSAACAFLLARNYLRTRARLLLWSAGCFLLLAGNNFVVVVDLLLMPDVDFSLVRIILSLTAVSVLLFGFVWDLERD
jgi:uncharacterized membrane protein YdjX (TVP38/TMEM64 family)